MGQCVVRGVDDLITFELESFNMVSAFPSVSTVSLKDAQPGSIVSIARHDGPKLALVADHFVDGLRSFVWLNPNFRDRPPVIFAEKWQNDPAILQYEAAAIRFEFGTKSEDIDPRGRNTWETPGVIVSINRHLFIRVAPQDPFYGNFRLVNIVDGSLYSDRPPDTLWTFLSWKLWVRDSLKRSDFMLTEFRAIP
jgi:hypothetical protein